MGGATGAELLTFSLPLCNEETPVVVRNEVVKSIGGEKCLCCCCSGCGSCLGTLLPPASVISVSSSDPVFAPGGCQCILVGCGEIAMELDKPVIALTLAGDCCSWWRS